MARKKKTSFKLATKITATFLLVFSLGVATWALTSSWKNPTDSKAAHSTFVKPIQLNEAEYSPGSYGKYGPFEITGEMLDSYDLGVLQKLIADRDASRGEVAEIKLKFGSITFLDRLKKDGLIDDLKSAGVTTIQYNPEGVHTPLGEFLKRFDDSDSNPIVQFAQWGEQNGFETLWTPLRKDADSTSDNTLRRIYSSGIDILSLQEQESIESSCPSVRYDAARDTIDRHKNLAEKDIGVEVQIMAEKCRTAENLNCSESHNYTYGHCDKFVDLIADSVDTISLLPSEGDLDLTKVLREGGLGDRLGSTGYVHSPVKTRDPNVTSKPWRTRDTATTIKPIPTQIGEDKAEECSLIDRFRGKCMCRKFGENRMCWKPSESSENNRYSLKDYVDILLDRQ